MDSYDLGYIFRDAGYRTLYAGKWHLGLDWDARNCGYEESYTFNGNEWHCDMSFSKNGERQVEFPFAKYSGVPIHPEAGKPFDNLSFPKHPYKSIAETDIALDWIKNHDYNEKPLFVFLSVHDPHEPYYYKEYEPPNLYGNQYKVVSWAEPAVPAEKGQAMHPSHTLSYYKEPFFMPNDTIKDWSDRLGYFASVTAVDDELGRVLKAVDDLPKEVADNTIVVYTSDHGYMEGDYGFTSKKYPHDGSSHVPFLVRWPNGIPKINIEIDNLFSTIDIFPTLCSLTRIGEFLKETGTENAESSLKYLHNSPGLDHSLNIIGQEGGPDPESVFVANISNLSIWAWSGMEDMITEEFLCRFPIHRTVVTKDYMYSVKGLARSKNLKEKDLNWDRETGDWLLYDRKKDPWQTDNLVKSTDCQDVITDLRRKIQQWITETEAPFREKWHTSFHGKESWNIEHQCPGDDEKGLSYAFDMRALFNGP